MLETLRQSIIIDFSIFLNSLIYFLKRVPLIKLVFKKCGYEHSEVTSVLFILGLIYAMFKQLFKSIMGLGLSFGIIYLFLEEDIANLNKPNLYWHIFLLFYILLALPSSKLLEPHRRKFIAVKLMRMNAKRFVLSDYFPQFIWRQLVELALFYFVAYLFNVNIVLALFMVTAKNFFALFAEYLHLKYYDITGNFLHTKTALNLTYSIIIIVIGYYSALNQYILPLPNQFIIALGVILWVIGLISINFILRYHKYSVAINDANRLDSLSIDMQSIKKNAEFSRVKLKDKEFSQKELQYDKSNKKEGFTYINDIFFKRHKRILNGPIKIEAIGILVLFALGIISSIFVPDFNSVYVKGVKKAFPVFIFALYMMSTGLKATKAMFYNCDISLLHYGFYKKKKAVLATFTIRAKHLLIANFIPAGLLAAAIILLDILTGGSFITLLPIAVMIIVLSIFFVIHNLFLYYIFQPFTTDLTVKNPLYKFFNFITYILCYISLQLENMSLTFLFAIVGLTLIYSVTALIVVYRVAPKTFTIK